MIVSKYRNWKFNHLTFLSARLSTRSLASSSFFSRKLKQVGRHNFDLFILIFIFNSFIFFYPFLFQETEGSGSSQLWSGWTFEHLNQVGCHNFYCCGSLWVTTFISLNILKSKRVWIGSRMVNEACKGRIGTHIRCVEDKRLILFQNWIKIHIGNGRTDWYEKSEKCAIREIFVIW